MVSGDPSSALIGYLGQGRHQDVVKALVRRVRAWRRVSGDSQDARERRTRIEHTLSAILEKNPRQRFALALEADREEPGPLPRILASLAASIDPPLAAELLNHLSSMDDRHRPLMLACTQELIDAGADDVDTVILHLYALRDSGDAKTAESLAKMALETATDPDELGRIDALLAEIAFEDQRFEEALDYWRASIRKDDATAMRLNNCGAALQYLGRPDEAAVSFLKAARVARQESLDDPESYRSRGSACVNMAMGALERGRTGAALSLARIGAERYRDLLARHPGHSDTDTVQLFSPLIVALEEAGLTTESQALAEEILRLAQARYFDNPDIGARGLIDAIKMLHQNALETGRYDIAQAYSHELRELAERHHGTAFGLNDEDLALALAAEADALFLDGKTKDALVVFDEVDALLAASATHEKHEEVFVTQLNHAMALNDDGQRAAAAKRLIANLAVLEDLAMGNGWLWTLVARGYADLAIVESERGRRAAAENAIVASKSAVAHVQAGGRNQWINAAEQHIAIANSLSHIGSYDDAIDLLKTTIAELKERLGPQGDEAASLLVFEALNDLGIISFSAGEHDGADQAFQQAIELGASASPGSVLSQRMARMLINRAGALAEGHRFMEASEALDQAERVLGRGDAAWTDYLNNRAAVLSGLGETSQALSYFRKARDAAIDDEDRFRAALNIAATLAELERWSEARDEANRIVSATHAAVVDPEGVDAVTLYYWVAARIIAARGAAILSPPDEALNEATQALSAFEAVSGQLGPDREQLYGYALEAVGDAFAAQGSIQEARDYWSEAQQKFTNTQARLWYKEIARLEEKQEFSKSCGASVR